MRSLQQGHCYAKELRGDRGQCGSVVTTGGVPEKVLRRIQGVWLGFHLQRGRDAGVVGNMKASELVSMRPHQRVMAGLLFVNSK